MDIRGGWYKGSTEEALDVAVAPEQGRHEYWEAVVVVEVRANQGCLNWDSMNRCLAFPLVIKQLSTSFGPSSNNEHLRGLIIFGGLSVAFVNYSAH